MQIILNWTGQPGSGKTHQMLTKMAAEPGRYVLACPRIDLIQEREKDLRSHAADAGTNPTIVQLHTKNGSRASVSRQLLEARDHCQSESHVMLVTTYQALVQSDLSGFAGWHARLDEAPSATKAESIKVPLSSRLILPNLFDLKPAGTSGWSQLIVKPGVTTLSKIKEDSLLKGTAEMYGLAMRPGVFVNVEDWSALHGSTNELRWVSVWTARELAAFDSCEIAASSYQHSLGHLVMQSCCPDAFEVIEKKVARRITSAVRDVEINYFTSSHEGSTEFWKSAEGSKCLDAVSAHLANEQIGYRSCNVGFDRHFSRLLGEHVAPKVEGTNSLSHHTSCAYIYTAKPQPADKSLTEMFGITREQITRARESEDVLQFAYRGAIRDPVIGGAYRVWLYELGQAETLKSMLEEEGFSVTLNGITQAGIMDVNRNTKPGRPKSCASDAERTSLRQAADKERKRRERAAAKKAKKLNRTLRGPGRPKKIAPSTQESGSPSTGPT